MAVRDDSAGPQSPASPAPTPHRRQLDRLQTSLASSTAQLKHAQTELGARDREAAGLRAEVESVRRRLAALQASQAQAATRDLVAAVAADPGLPPEVAQALALDHARRQLRSELSWTRAKLAFVCSMAAGLRRKLAQAQADRAQAGEWRNGDLWGHACVVTAAPLPAMRRHPVHAHSVPRRLFTCGGRPAEAEGVCVEAHHLQQAVMDQRAFAAAYEAGAVQARGARGGWGVGGTGARAQAPPHSMLLPGCPAAWLLLVP